MNRTKNIFGFFEFPLKIMGLTAFLVKTRGQHRLLWWSLVVGHLLTWSSISIPLYSWFAVKGPGRFNTALIVTWIDRTVSFITSATLLVMANFQSSNIARLQRALEQDWEATYLQDSAPQIETSAMRRWSVPLVTVFTFCVIGLECSLGYDNIAQLAPLCYLRLVTFSSEIMFVAPVLALDDQFCLLNRKLEQYFRRTHQWYPKRTFAQVLPMIEASNKNGGALVPFGTVDELRTLSAIHWKLCSVGTHVNSAFSGQSLLLLVSLFVSVISRPYFIFLSLNQADIASDALNLVLYSGWVCVYALQIFLLVWPCSITRDEAAHTSTVIAQNLNKSTPPRERKMLEMFLVQLMNRKLDFTVYTLFTMDLTVLTSVAGAVTTYLVILIQFQNS